MQDTRYDECIISDESIYLFHKGIHNKGRIDILNDGYKAMCCHFKAYVLV